MTGRQGGPATPLPADFYVRPVLEVAPDLLGCVVRHRTSEGAVAVRLTEVEAYAGGDDPGSHAWRGLTPRTSVMFGPPGRAYVYFTYGMHWCLNLVCAPEGTASAVLLRAGEVVEGRELARSRRPAARHEHDLARGPARLTQCLGVDSHQWGLDTTDPRSLLQVTRGASPVAAASVRTGPRVGLSRAGDRPWRFWAAGEPAVSAYRPYTPRRRRATGSGTLDADRPTP